MKNSLKKITNKTLKELLQNEIILPSSYFKSFEQNAKKLSVDINDKHFQHEVSDVIEEELKLINHYMSKALNHLNELSEATDDAQRAIKDKDEDKLNTINATLVTLKNELSTMKTQMYRDPLTKTFNRRWLYDQGIQEDGTFKESGLLLFIHLNDCDYLTQQYGTPITDNVISYITKFIVHKFKSEAINYKIVRYSEDQLLLLIQNDSQENINPFTKGVRLELSNTTLKTKSGLMFNTSFYFGLVEYNARDNFQNMLEKTAALSLQEQAG